MQSAMVLLLYNKNCMCQGVLGVYLAIYFQQPGQGYISLYVTPNYPIEKQNVETNQDVRHITKKLQKLPFPNQSNMRIWEPLHRYVYVNKNGGQVVQNDFLVMTKDLQF